ATRLSDQITLSTFHGCPAGEIEGIVRFLLTEMDVHVTVKLNPTLLGRQAVASLLHDALGYHEVRTRAEDFDTDPQWCQALGFTPITTCTDLLRPGGYGRLPRYMALLEECMRALGATRLGDYVVRAFGRGEEAVSAETRDGPARGSVLAALAGGADVRAAAEAAEPGLFDRIVRRAAVLNTPLVAARAAADPRYQAEKNRVAPRKIGSHLALFDSINCDKCLPVCPNDANFVYETGPLSVEHGRFVVRERPVSSTVAMLS